MQRPPGTHQHCAFSRILLFRLVERGSRVLLAFAVFPIAFSAGWANAGPIISLKNGKVLEIASISRQAGTVSVVTPSGTKLNLPESQMIPPVEKWIAESKEAEQQGRFSDAMEYLRLIAMWDPAKKDPIREAAMESKIQDGLISQFQAELDGRNYSGAAEIYAKLAKSSPAGALAGCKAALAQFLAKAKQAAIQGRFDDAEKMCKGCLVVAPGFPEASQALAEISKARDAAGKVRADAAFEQRLQKAGQLIEVKQYDSARRILIALRNECPSNPLARSKLQNMEKRAMDSEMADLLAPPPLIRIPGQPPVGPNTALRPTIHLTSGQHYMAGTAFLAQLDPESNPILLTAHHIFGPSGGLSKQIELADLDKQVEYIDAFSLSDGKLVSRAKGSFMATGDASQNANREEDVAAFQVVVRQKANVLSLAKSNPAKGDPVWVLGEETQSRSPQQRLWQGKVEKVTPGQLLVSLINAPKLQGFSGAPVVNLQGEVVGMVRGLQKGYILCNNLLNIHKRLR